MGSQAALAQRATTEPTPVLAAWLRDSRRHVRRVANAELAKRGAYVMERAQLRAQGRL